MHLDKSKVFDKMEHTYLASVLEADRLGPNLHRWIAAYHSVIEHVVKVKGFSMKQFQTERSVRQVCPLTPLLYLIAPETLLQKLDEVGRTQDGLWCGHGALA